MTPIYDPGRASVPYSDLIEWAKRRDAHPRFLTVIELYVDLAPGYGIPAEIPVVQSGHETGMGHYTGIVTPDMHNWAGIKTANATGDRREDHQSFSSDVAGVIAHLQHISRYAGRAADTYPHLVAYERWNLVPFGAAPNVEQLGGKYAPRLDYGTDLADIIGDLRAVEVTISENPGYTVKLSPCFGYPIGARGRGGQLLDRLIIHTTEGEYAGALSHLTRYPTADDEGSSAHVLIGRSPLHLAHIVNEGDAAWTAGNGLYNRRGYNIELVGYADRNPPVNRWQIEECGRVCARVITRNPHLLAIEHFGVMSHDNVPGQDHTDPGPHFDWGYLDQCIRDALTDGAPAPPKPRTLEEIATDAILDSHTGIWISRVFLNHMLDATSDQVASVDVFGRPITGAFIAGDGQLVQWFERACLGYHPEHAGTTYQVQGRLIGTELHRLLQTANDSRVSPALVEPSE